MGVCFVMVGAIAELVALCHQGVISDGSMLCYGRRLEVLELYFAIRTSCSIGSMLDEKGARYVDASGCSYEV